MIKSNKTQKIEKFMIWIRKDDGGGVGQGFLISSELLKGLKSGFFGYY